MELRNLCPWSARWVVGSLYIIFVAVIWTLATVLKQVIFDDLDYDQPLVLTYVCNACYVLHIPVHVIGQKAGCFAPIPWRASSDPEEEGSEDRGSVLEAVRVGLLISPLWFAAQWTYAQGVATTSVTSSTVISTTSVVWTLLASVAFLGERLTFLKVLGILACMGGNVATLWGGDMGPNGQEHLIGDIWCLVSAVLYAAYTTVLKRFTRPSTSVGLLFGALGLAVLVVGTPLTFGLAPEGMRRLTWELFGLLIFNGLFDNVLSQWAWAKAVQYTSPTAATVGLSLTIPLSVVADYVRQNRLTIWSYVASALVIAGFVIVTLASRPQETKPSDRAFEECAVQEGEHSVEAQVVTPLSSNRVL